MSANLDLVKSIYEAWGKGDFSSADWADPEIEFVIVDGPTPGSAKGLAEMAALWRSGLDAWEDLRTTPSEFRELADGRVLVFLENTGRGKGSGIEVREITAKSANLFTIRGGKITRLVAYWDREHAISELGLGRRESH